MKKSHAIVLLPLCLLTTASFAVTNECHVAEGETKSVSDFGYAWADGDWLLKTGPGRLNAVNNTTVKYNLLISEGVYYVGNSIYQQGGATLIVRKGAAVNCVGNEKDMFKDNWNVYLAGDGVGTGDDLGAFCLGGSQMNPTFGTSSRFYLSDDATIYSYGTMNAVISGSAATSGPTLYMNSHTLTIRGKSSTSVFRPRWKWTIGDHVGPMIVRNGQFARHDTTNDFQSNIPLISVKDNGKLASYGDGKIWSKVDAFDFEYGSSMAKGNGSPTIATLTMKKLTGPATVNDTVLTVSDELSARGSDLAANHFLKVDKALAFSNGCRLAVTELFLLAPNPGVTYVIAESNAEITGVPTLTGEAADFFTVEVVGKQLLIKAKATNLFPSLQEGEEHAADNSAAMAALTLAEGSALVFPAGDYRFSEPIDFTGATASNVTICGFAETSTVLRTGMMLGAMKAVTVRNLTFKGFDTPAVVATGTVGLTVEDCTLESVKGTYGEAGNYPYALVNVTDFNLKNPTYVPDAADAEPTLWDGQAYFQGGSQTTDSDARDGMVVFFTRNGIVRDDWWNIQNVTNALHLAPNGYQGKTLCKTGPATLDATSNVKLGVLGIAGIEVQAGQYVARVNGSLGVEYAPVHVCSGANLTLCADDNAAAYRTISFSGTGLNVYNPAVRFTGSAKWDKTSNVTWLMEGDAAMYNNCSGENGTFLWSTVKTGGHTLTLKGISSANYRFGRSTDWYGGGTVVADGVAVSASSGTGFVLKDGVKPLFKFVNKAKFIPDNADILGIVRDVDFAVGTTIGCKSSNAGFALTFDSLTGAPTVNEAYTKMTIKEAYAVRMADVTAGSVLTLGSATPLAFADGVTLTLLSDGLAAPTEFCTVISAPAGITGRRPKLDAVSKAAGWALRYSADRTELLAGPRQGTFLIVR